MRDFLKARDLFFFRFPQEANQALEGQREILATEVTTDICESREELSLQALHAEGVSRLQENLNFYEKYDVTITTKQHLRLYHQGIGQTWSPTNPGHQKASNELANYAAQLCN